MRIWYPKNKRNSFLRKTARSIGDAIYGQPMKQWQTLIAPPGLWMPKLLGVGMGCCCASECTVTCSDREECFAPQPIGDILITLPNGFYLSSDQGNGCEIFLNDQLFTLSRLMDYSFQYYAPNICNVICVGFAVDCQVVIRAFTRCETGCCDAVVAVELGGLGLQVYWIFSNTSRIGSPLNYGTFYDGVEVDYSHSTISSLCGSVGFLTEEKVLVEYL